MLYSLTSGVQVGFFPPIFFEFLPASALGVLFWNKPKISSISMNTLNLISFPIGLTSAVIPVERHSGTENGHMFGKKMFEFNTEHQE